MTGLFLEQQVRKIIAEALEILLELNMVLMIQEMQLVMHASQRSDATGRNVQLRGCFGCGRGTALE